MTSKRNLSLAFLLIAVCLVYANSLGNSFHFDDFHTITDNPAVRSLGNLRRIFTDTTAFSVLPANQTYRPTVTASLALDYALGSALGGGYVPFMFHLSTLLWFLLLITVLFFFVQLLLDRTRVSAANDWVALGVAAWFGLHPAMAETINYVIQRGDLYCTLGCVAALFTFARWPRLRRYGLYLVPLVLAMLSKPPAAVFPLLLLLYVFFFEASPKPVGRRWAGHRSAGHRWAMSLLPALPSLVVTGLMLSLQSAMTPKSFLPSILSPSAYRLTQPFVWLRYACALFLPLHLNVDTDLQPFQAVNADCVAGLVFVFGLFLVIAYTSRRRWLYPVAFGLLWFLITQLPTSLYPLSEVENDHRMFFSFPGLLLAVVYGLSLGYEGLGKRWFTTPNKRRHLQVVTTMLATCVLCGYAWGAHRRNEVWRSESTLWADDVQKSPHNGRGLMIYGLTRMNEGDYPGALDLFNRALEYTPNYPTLEINLGVVNGLLAAGQPALEAAAEDHFKRAVALAPGDDTTHGYYGRWLLTQGRFGEATGQLGEAVALNPGRLMQRDLLLGAYRQAGNRAAARQLAAQTLAIAPDDVAALAALKGTPENRPGTVAECVNASLADFRLGRFQQSIDEARRALALDADSAAAWNNIGAGEGALHHWDAAIAADRKAVSLQPDFQLAKNNLAWAQEQKSASARR